MPLVIANICSTSAALFVSLLLNYRFTFQGNTLTRRKVAEYIGVTLVGLWILQPIVITGLIVLNNHVNITALISIGVHNAKILDNVIPKVGSIAVTLVWNYVWYSRLVFRAIVKPGQLGIAQKMPDAISG